MRWRRPQHVQAPETKSFGAGRLGRQSLLIWRSAKEGYIMRGTRILSLLAVLLLCGFWGASPALASTSVCGGVPGNLVTNCGFETGDFTGWTFTGNTANPGGNYYGVDGFDANSGNYGAYLSQDFFNAGDLVMSQTVGGTGYVISFYLEQDTAPTPGYTHYFQVTFGGLTLLTLTPTVATPGPVGVFTEYSFALTPAQVSALTSNTLSFTIENDDNYWSLDDVAVVTPEPASIWLLGTTLLGSGSLRLRRKFGKRSGVAKKI